MKRIQKQLAAPIIGVLAILAFTFGTVTPSYAATSTLHRNNGGNIFMTQKVGSNTGILIRNNTSFAMRCWVDGPWTTTFGNYRTNRYFYGTAYTSVGARNGYVTASVVINQTRVNHC